MNEIKKLAISIFQSALDIVIDREVESIEEVVAPEILAYIGTEEEECTGAVGRGETSMGECLIDKLRRE